jgi:hypothetical protein
MRGEGIEVRSMKQMLQPGGNCTIEHGYLHQGPRDRHSGSSVELAMLSSLYDASAAGGVGASKRRQYSKVVHRQGLVIGGRGGGAVKVCPAPAVHRIEFKDGWHY